MLRHFVVHCEKGAMDSGEAVSFTSQHSPWSQRRDDVHGGQRKFYTHESVLTYILSTTDSQLKLKFAFLQHDFDADTFVKVQQATKSASLEELRDDLGLYLKILRSSMIDLINRDYADFVNLSTNLTGLDKLIDALKRPLGQLREEVLNVKQVISQAIDLVKNDLTHRQKIREEKALFHRLCQISNRLARLEKLVESSRFENGYDEELIDRVASEVNHLNFLVAKCEGAALLDTFKPRVNNICCFVEGGLEKSLKQGIKGDKESLVRTLRIYTSLGTINHAHLQVQLLIREKLDKIIQDDALKSDPRGLRGVYEKILHAIHEILDPLLAVQTEKKCDGVGEFFFVEECAFPEITQLMVSRLIHIFNPGNPVAFHQRYLETLHFVEEFEKLIANRQGIERFRQTKDYVTFMEQWNLSVYLQIRYQEIGLVVEACLSGDDKGLSSTKCDEGFVFESTSVVYTALQKCFDPHNFLLALLHRFFKIALLILSRHRTWLSTTLRRIKEADEKKEEKDTYQTNGSVCELRSGDGTAIDMYADITKLHHKLASFFEYFVEQRVIDIPLDKQNLIKENLNCQRTKLLAFRVPILDMLTQNLIGNCVGALKQVSDTPRLYRRTNKPIPTTSQTYLEVCLRHLVDFTKQSRDKLEQITIIDITKNVFIAVVSRYRTFIYEVLNSVYKMEESLKRLKRARERGVVSNNDSTASVSDDDKIRMQIYWDVESLGKQISSMGVPVDEIDAYILLLKMVTKAKNGEFVPSEYP